MTPTTATPWTSLDAAGKHARVLAVARELFTREGIDAPMPALAEAIGVGVGSIYRQVGRKEDILAALTVEHLRRAAERMEAGLEHADAWEGLSEVVDGLVAEAAADGLAREVWPSSSTHPAVTAERPRVTRALEALVRRAHAQSALRADVTVDDVRLVLQTSKQAHEMGPSGACRLAELALRGMRPDAA